MINCDVKKFVNPETVLKEYSYCIYYSLPKKEQKIAKQDWLEAGGPNNTPWWKWILAHCSITYEN